jgi:hypothetical protein
MKRQEAEELVASLQRANPECTMDQIMILNVCIMSRMVFFNTDKTTLLSNSSLFEVLVTSWFIQLLVAQPLLKTL